MEKPRTLFMGTPEFALPALEALVRHGYPVIGCVTQPDRPQGRGRQLSPPPVKVLAERLGLPVFQPERVRADAFLATFRELAPELVVLSAFGQILPSEILQGPRLGCVNIHPSLLPRYRGAAPLHWALLNGDEATGVTIMQMDEGLDSGAILLQEETPILPEETYGELHDRLARWGAELLLVALAMQQAGTLQPRPQDQSQVTLAPRLRKEDGRIRWDSDVRKIVSLVRGLSPDPCAYTALAGKQLKVFRATAEPREVPEAPGTVGEMTPHGLRVAAPGGTVLIQEVQLEGKKRMAITDFLRGVRLVPGTVLG
jgi:methionyl-tRNA formyltransferase